MALVNYSFTALLESDAAGQNTAANQAVSVKLEFDNGLATIYSDAAGTTPIAQPGAVTDANGVLSFWVLPGYYKIESATRVEYAYIDDGSRLSPETLAYAQSQIKQYKIGEFIKPQGRATKGDGGAATWEVIAKTTENGFDIVTGDTTRSLQYIQETPINANALGAFAGESTAAIQAAIDLLSSGPAGGGIVSLDNEINYIISGAGIVIPANVTLDCNDARITYTGSGVAFTLGDSDNVLSFNPKLLNLNLLVSAINVTGVRMRCTRGGKVTGMIEGTYAPFDNTRTNTGVWIDAVNASSFFNEVSVRCNHLHTSFNIESSGTSFSTNNLLINCSTFGDHTTDTTSRGVAIGINNSLPEGQGLQIIGGNIEQCEIGVLVGPFSGPVAMLGTRFEAGSNTIDARFMSTGNEANTMIGCANADLITIDYPTSSKLVRFDSTGRLGRQETGQTIANRLYLDGGAGATFNVLTNETSSGTGLIRMQAGAGSATFGASTHLYAQAHASKPGDHVANITSTGSFRVNNDGVDTGADLFKVDQNSTAGNTRMMIWDVDNATLERVSVGAADSGGTGYKVLRILN